jgi:hypothetical protein
MPLTLQSILREMQEMRVAQEELVPRVEGMEER